MVPTGGLSEDCCITGGIEAKEDRGEDCGVAEKLVGNGVDGRGGTGADGRIGIGVGVCPIGRIGGVGVGLGETGMTGVGEFNPNACFDNNVEGCSAGNRGADCTEGAGLTGGIIGDV